MDLPPGFRFHPTDEEIIIHYLVKKVLDRRFRSRAITEADMNKCEPWDLTGNEKNGEIREWFFCKKDRKYPTGTRTNRATESGYWKATGKDREIFKGKKCLIGMRKTLVFYKGRAPKGEKTGWIMHEYRLEGSFCTDYYNIPNSTQEDWAVCRIFRRNMGVVNRSTHPSGPLSRIEQRFLDSPTLPPLMDASYRPTSSFTTHDQDEEFIKENSSLSEFQDPNRNSHTSPRTEFGRSGLRIVTENQGILLDSPTMVYKMDQYFSMMNSTIGVCQDTSMAPSKEEIERDKPFNDEFDDLPFSPTVSNLDDLWSY